MNIKKRSRILCALSALVLSMACVCAPGHAITYHGGEHGKVTLNDWEYNFITRIETGLMTGGYQSVCTSEAAVVRVHHDLYVDWFTKYHGVVTTFGGSRSTGQPMYGTSRSNLIPCPTGVSQGLKYARVKASITMWGDVAVTSNITLKSGFPRPTRF